MKIEHLAMYVWDLEQAKAFFMKYFDGKANRVYHNQKTGFMSYFITFDEGSRLEIMTHPDRQNHMRDHTLTGYQHIAFSVGSMDKVNQMTLQLKQDGYRIFSEPRHTGDGYYESCILDNEGNQIELTV